MLVGDMCHAGIRTTRDYEVWSRDHTGHISDMIGHPSMSDLPPGRLLMKPFFHPKLLLIGLNYGNAQQLLRGHPEGWTDSLRYCRGIVFDHNEDLVALPYAKFFNLFNHEHPEADNPPDGPFEATVKLDGHFGIIFHYADKWHLTTHGSFVSRSAKLGQEMLDKLVRWEKRQKFISWSGYQEQQLNPLVEIIHPSTRIRCDYHGHQGLVLTGMTNRVEMNDKSYEWLAHFGPRFGMHVTDIWNDFTLDELRHEVTEQKPKDREGFVIRWPDGTRGKLKYKHYLDRMSDQNLSYNALMHSSIDGTLKSKMDKLPEELWEYADDMIKKLEKAHRMADKKAALVYLCALVPPEKSTQYFRTLCRQFLEHKP